jgi:hypothetical protein
MEFNNEWREEEFEEAGITFFFPPGLEHIKVNNLGDPPDPWPDPKDATFKPDGFVFNFEFSSNDPAHDPIPNEPFRMLIKYKQIHLDNAGYSCLQLGINKVDNKGWRNLTSGVDPNNKFTYKKGPWIGGWLVTINDWISDPVVAWGP